MGLVLIGWVGNGLDSTHSLPLHFFFFLPIPFFLLPSFLPLKHGEKRGNHGCVGDPMSPTMSPTFFLLYIYILTFYSTLNKKKQ